MITLEELTNKAKTDSIPNFLEALKIAGFGSVEAKAVKTTVQKELYVEFENNCIIGKVPFLGNQKLQLYYPCSYEGCNKLTHQADFSVATDVLNKLLPTGKEWYCESCAWKVKVEADRLAKEKAKAEKGPSFWEKLFPKKEKESGYPVVPG